jgi:ubiquinone biosynthesis protein
MARLLTQLFEVTEIFQMRMRPELLLLQKTMVVVEGVARSLDPNLNIWTAAEPIVRAWIEEQLGPAGQLRGATADLGALAAVIRQAPQLIERGARIAEALSKDERAAMAAAPKIELALAIPLWLGAAALAGILIKLLLA